MEEKIIQFYCNYDDEGKFTEILTGERIIPVKQYMYHDVIDKKTELNIDKFCIKDGKLVQCDDTTLTEIGVIRPTTEQELETVKQQLATVQEQNELIQEQNNLMQEQAIKMQEQAEQMQQQNVQMQEQAAQTQLLLQQLLNSGLIPGQPSTEEPKEETPPTEETEQPPVKDADDNDTIQEPPYIPSDDDEEPIPDEEVTNGEAPADDPVTEEPTDEPMNEEEPQQTT